MTTNTPQFSLAEAERIIQQQAAQIAQLETVIAQQITTLRRLEARVAELEGQLDEAKRAGKRQATPFRKARRKPSPRDLAGRKVIGRRIVVCRIT